MNGSLLRLEALRLGRSPWAFAILLIAALLAFYALANGQSDRVNRTQVQSRFLEEARKDANEHAALLQALEAGKTIEDYEARPMRIAIPAVLPDGPLGDFAIGAGDIFPDVASARLVENSATLFRNYQFENPDMLRLGRFDMTTLVIVILPLLMIALSFDTVGTDRTRGTLRILLAQGASLRSIIWTRLVLRNGILWTIVIAAALIALPAQIGEAALGARAAHLAAWLAIAICYGLVWFGGILVAVIFVRRTEHVAAFLLSAWALFVMVLPAASVAIGEWAHPPPSRLAYLSAVRATTSEAEQRGDAWLADYARRHPDLDIAPESEEPWFRKHYVQTMMVEERTAPLRQAFLRARSDREALLGITQYLSPALVAERALYDVAGASALVYQRFQDDAARLLFSLAPRIGPATLRGGRISVAEHEALPKFEDHASRSQIVNSSFLAAVAYLILILLITIASAQMRSARSDASL